MMSNNKILTVSYGTFSCTLEGFDDSFGTMKAIAEYFRDLAADDRYFGAEPPQPDAEMLARIAQKEISRRVQAREHDGKIVLSALQDHRDAPQTPVAKAPDTPDTPVAAAPTTAPDVPAAGIAAMAGVAADSEPQETRESQDVEPEAPVADTAAQATVPQTTAAEPVDEDDTAIAAEAHVDLKDLEPTAIEPQEDAAIAPAPEQTDAQEIDYVADTTAVGQAETLAEDDAENDIVPGQPDSDVEAFFADSATGAGASDMFDDDTSDDADQPEMAETDALPIAQAAPVAAAPAPDSIAAKLQRIRAVVAQHDDTAEDDTYAEDEHAIVTSDDIQPAAQADEIDFDDDDGADDSQQDAVAQARHDIEDALDADDAVEQAEEEDDYSDILNRLAMHDDAAGPAQTDDAEDDLDNATESDDALSNLFGDDEDEDEAEAGGEDFAEAEDAYDVAAESEAEDDLDVATEVAEETDIATAPKTPAAHPRARVIKVKRADLEAAIERGELEEYDDEDDDDDFDMSDIENEDMALDDLAPAKSASTSLSPEDEQELARELAALEKDIEGDSASQDTPEDHTSGASRSVLPAIEDETSGDMTRLMAEADHQMDEPESTTRRNAFAHLRAAVAAKKADNAIGTDAEQEKKDRAFRSDLEEVVRPRRPVGTGIRTARPEESRPAPLKLVAEQRIDVESPRPVGPVRPRRVSAVVAEPKAPTDGTATFAEYAEEMGAHSLSELLEAAAAYMSFVEGFEQFSRPQLMTKVRQVGPEDGFSREDGLRSFGQLLRAGKIEKIKGGRFTVSEDIGYRPDQRAAS